MQLDPDICYRAILARDARFDGRFFTGVHTTGIYCRPICSATAPRRDHVSFHPSAAAARITDQYRLGLRAGDALHLAICTDHGATLCTLDRRLGEAGAALGVKTMVL